MPTQFQIEQAAGITDEALGRHISAGGTPAARNAQNLLAMLCACYEEAGFALLCEAVKDCKRELPNTCPTDKPQVQVVRNAGHPWDGAPGWDLMDIQAETPAALAAAIAAAQSKYWQVWIDGVQESTGKPGAVLYKPHGATAPWKDPGLKQL